MLEKIKHNLNYYAFFEIEYFLRHSGAFSTVAQYSVILLMRLSLNS